MRRERAIIITSHVDLHGERGDPDSLEPVATEMNRKYLPLNVEHDLWKPPIGRIAASEVIQLEDGERAVESIIEIFEDGDSADLLVGDGRSIEVSKSDVPTFRVEYDRSYDTEDGQRLISALRALSHDSEVAPVAKKALEPISTLIIAAGVFIAGTIAKSFFTKLGEDLYKGLKTILANHFERLGTSTPRLLDLRLTAVYKEDFVEVHVLLENPTAAALEALFTADLAGIDDLVLGIDTGGIKIAKFVFQYKDGQLTILHAVSRACAPLRLL